LLRTLCAINTLLVTSMFMLAANPMACIIWPKHKSTQAIYIPLRLLTPEMNSLHQFPYSCPVRILLCEELRVQVSLKHSVTVHVRHPIYGSEPLTYLWIRMPAPPWLQFHCHVHGFSIDLSEVARQKLSINCHPLTTVSQLYSDCYTHRMQIDYQLVCISTRPVLSVLADRIAESKTKKILQTVVMKSGAAA
jgi:hypothetical protein